MDDGQNVKEIKEVSSNLKTLPFIFKERIDNMIPEFPANSNKSKEERKPLKPVVDTPALIKKPKKVTKLHKLIFAKDFDDIKQGLYKEYVEPKAKELSWNLIQACIDYVTNAFRMMVYEDYKHVERSKLPAERYSYNHYYTYSQPTVNRSTAAPSVTTELNYDEFLYPTAAKADLVLAELKNQIATCKCATVLDLYDLSGVATSNYTLQNWGWTDLGFAEVRQTLDENHNIVYMISLPKAKPLPR